ncbi:hypothetical protein [Streptomyces sp. NPDC004599]
MSKARGTPHHRQARDDVLENFHLRASTQIDGLRHRRASGHGFYNGVPDDEITPPAAPAWASSSGPRFPSPAAGF